MLNYNFSSSKNINLSLYFKKADIIAFLNNDQNHLQFDFAYHFKIIFEIFHQSKNFNHFLVELKKQNIELLIEMLKVLKLKYVELKNAKDKLIAWKQAFEWKKIFLKYKNNLLLKQLIHDQNIHLNQVHQLVICTNFIANHNQTKNNIINAPLVFFPVEILIDANDQLQLVKAKKYSYWFNPELTNEKINFLKKFNFNDFDRFLNYQQIRTNLIAKNHFQLNGANYSNQEFVLKEVFYLSNIDHTNVVVDWKNALSFNSLASFNTNFKFDFHQPKIFFNYENNLFNFKKQNIIHYNAANIINAKLIFDLVFANLVQNKNTIVFHDQYQLFNEMINTKNDNYHDLKSLIFFNYDDSQATNFYDQLLTFKAQLDQVFEKNWVSSSNQNFNPAANQIFEQLYQLKSLQKQSLDDALVTINQKEKNKTWSQAALVAFKYCQEQNINLKSLFQQIKLICQLSTENKDFLNSYGYDQFWKNLATHKNFLFQYDQNNVAKGLYYLKKYIEDHKFPDRVRIYTLTEEDQIYYTEIYKFFYHAATSNLFYVSQKDLKLLLNFTDKDQHQFLALVNYQWIKDLSIFQKFQKLNLLQLTNKNYQAINWKDDNKILVQNYFLDLQKRIQSASEQKQKIIFEMFDLVEKRPIGLLPSVFLKHYWKIIIDLFPFIIWDLNKHHQLNQKIAHNQFLSSYWFISHTKQNMLLDILSFPNNNQVFYLYQKNDLNPKILAAINQNNVVQNDLTYNLNLNNYSIAKLIDPNFHTINTNNLVINDQFVSIAIKDQNYPEKNLLSILEKLVSDLITWLTYQKQKSTCLVVVKDTKIKNQLLKMIVINSSLLQACHQGWLIIVDLDQEIKFFVDRLILVLSDRISLTNNILDNQNFYNDPKSLIKIKKFLFWTKNKIIVYHCLKEQKLEFKNKINQLFFQCLVHNSQNHNHQKLSNLALNFYQEIGHWILQILSSQYHVKLVFNQAIKQYLIQISDQNNRVVLLIKLINNDQIDFNQQLELDQLLKLKGYKVFSIFAYEWVFKEKLVKEKIIQHLKNNNLISNQ
ncbi:hypothetical protein MCAV_00330 [[Mycoplasma] cavipharyngis]|uniref:hypothetical protein n=1 Tax=[Mycoplasma] cavipharyngis TaxID=92757 RepID=UPI0037047DA6